MRKTLFLFLLLSSLTACHHRGAITARSEYFDAKYLAASQVETPDPRRSCFVGQQVIVSWNVPARCLPAEIVFSVRYGDRGFDEVVYPVNVPRGYWIYRLLNKEFWCHQGIISYSAKIYHGEDLIGQWDHHLWADLVELPIIEN